MFAMNHFKGLLSWALFFVTCIYTQRAESYVLRGLTIADLDGKQKQKTIHKPQKDTCILEEKIKYGFCACNYCDSLCNSERVVLA